MSDAPGAGGHPGTRPRVLLVHGLWMHGAVFALMRLRLARLGFATGILSYPSARAGLDANALALAARAGPDPAAGPCHIVGHSLGGLLALRMMALRPQLSLGRVVLLGSPVQGSCAARALLGFGPTARLIGPSVRDWLALAPPDWPLTAETGVIAGTRSLATARFITSIPRPNDGVVGLEETRLAGSHDRLTLHVGHSEMLLSRELARQTAHFLRSGRFDRSVPGKT